MTGEKKKRWLFKREVPAKLFGPYDQTQVQLDATYQYMRENIASCMYNEDSETCDTVFHHIFDDMEKPRLLMPTKDQKDQGLLDIDQKELNE